MSEQKKEAPKKEAGETAEVVPETDSVEVPETAAEKTVEEAVESPVSPDAVKKQGPNEPGFLKRGFKSVAGVTISGSLLTSGIATWAEVGSYWTSMSLSEQFINTASTLSGHLAVWSVAMLSGALGWGLGKQFDDTSSKWKPRAAAAGVGAALIAASFAFPLNEYIGDGVKDTLSSVFGVASGAEVGTELPIKPSIPAPAPG